MPLDDLETDFERAEYLQGLLVSEATGGPANAEEYQTLRRQFLNNPATKTLVPRFVRTCRDLGQFWQFIKGKFAHYVERRRFLWDEFAPLLDHLEGAASAPADKPISDALQSFDQDNVHTAWSRALERKTRDPEGAITAARTLLESVCKHILDESGVAYPKRVELHELYSLTAKELSLSPSQHTEKIFKQILGGCSAVINGLGTLRNALGDAHGKGKKPVRPAPRHAELAVNLAGTVAVFLVATWHARKGESPTTQSI